MNDFRKWLNLFETHDFNVDAYHGTTKNFDEFKNKDFAQLGYHFGSTPDQANNRIKRKHGRNIMPVKLRLKNPLRIHDMGDWSPPNVIWSIQYFYGNNIPIELNNLVRQLKKKFYELDLQYRNDAIIEISKLRRAARADNNNQPPKNIEKIEKKFGLNMLYIVKKYKINY
jgi:hypothetical protein